MNNTTEYWQKQTTAKSHKQFWNTSFHEARVQQIIRTVDKYCPGSETVLDAGAGTCRLGKPFIDAGYDYTAVDWSESMLSECNGEFETVVSGLTKMPFADSKFDCVVCSHVIRHNEPADYNQIIDELCRVSNRCVVIVNPFVLEDADITRMFKSDIPDFPMVVSELDDRMCLNDYRIKRRVGGLMTYRFKGITEELMVYEAQQ